MGLMSGLCMWSLMDRVQCGSFLYVSPNHRCLSLKEMVWFKTKSVCSYDLLIITRLVAK